MAITSAPDKISLGFVNGFSNFVGVSDVLHGMCGNNMRVALARTTRPVISRNLVFQPANLEFMESMWYWKSQFLGLL